MFKYAAGRLIYVLPILLGVSLVCFVLIHLAPGDPLSALAPDNTSPEILQRIKEAYGLDKPLPVQYLLWLGHVMRGDFGTSFSTQRPVLSEILPATLNSLQLAAGAMAMGVLAGVGFGSLAAYRKRSILDRLVALVGTACLSLPQYWVGIVLVVIFAVDFRLLPATGMGEPGAGAYARFLHLVMPTVTLALIPVGIIARSTRVSVAYVLDQDFIQALRARGLSERRIFIHVLKNAAAPILAVVGLQFSHLLGGSILVETVFSWPGAGFLLNSAIFMRDLPLAQGTILFLAVFFVMTNLLVDIIQMGIDPRVRRSRSARGSG